jgi:hypothetical protein
MMRFSRTVLLLALTLAAGARAAAAQTIPSPYEYIDKAQSLGVFGGYLLTDPDVSITDSTSAAMGTRSAPMFGVRYQVRASGPLSIDATVGISPTTRRLFDADLNADSVTVVSEDLETEVPATVVMADVGLRFHVTGPRTWNGLAPFVGASGGLVGDIRGSFAEEQDIDADARFRFGPSFAVGAGLGTDWFPARNASIRVELQGKLWRVSTPDGFLLGTEEERSQWSPVLGISVGGALHF